MCASLEPRADDDLGVRDQEQRPEAKATSGARGRKQRCGCRVSEGRIPVVRIAACVPCGLRAADPDRRPHVLALRPSQDLAGCHRRRVGKHA
ncbi:hypothetical protein MRX96_049074 [Rhipicephalus microplus]